MGAYRAARTILTPAATWPDRATRLVRLTSFAFAKVRDVTVLDLVAVLVAEKERFQMALSQERARARGAEVALCESRMVTQAKSILPWSC